MYLLVLPKHSTFIVRHKNYETYLSKTRIVAIVIVVVVVAASVAVMLYVHARNQPKSSLVAPSSLSDLRQQVSKLEFHKQYRQAVDLVSAFISAKPSSQDEEQAYILKGEIEESEAQPSQALVSYQTADTLAGGKDGTLVASIARSAEESGNKELALENYRKLLTTAQSGADYPGKQDEINQIKKHIQDLGGQP